MDEPDLYNQYVTFRVDNELYALDVFKSREILEIPHITAVPGIPEMFRGVINVRGDVVTVLDLKRRLGDDKTDIVRETVIIIAEMQYKDEIILMGLIVDEVIGVVTLEHDRVEAPPKLVKNADNQTIKGIGKTDAGFVLILDIDRILSEQEVSVINEIK